MASSIKINRARNMAQMLPRAEAEILSSIPDSLVSRLTATELSLVMQALNIHWHKAAAWKERDILGEGCIWDPSQQKLREIAD